MPSSSSFVKSALILASKFASGSSQSLYVDTDGNLFTHSSDQPFTGSRPVDLTADTTFTTPPRAVYVGTAGTLKVDCLDLDGVTTLTAKTIAVTDFQMLPFASIKKIYSTANGTTASNLWVGA